MVRSSTGAGGFAIVTADRLDDRPAIEAAVRRAIARRSRVNVFARLGSTVLLAARVVPHRVHDLETRPSCPRCGEPLRLERVRGNHDRPAVRWLGCGCRHQEGHQEGHALEREAAPA